MFRNLDELVEGARRLPPARIAVVAGHDVDAIEALEQARGLGLAEGIFVGDADRIADAVAKAGVEVAAERIIREPDEAAAARRALALVREGAADLLMKGKIGTGALMRAVLDRESGLRAGRLLSQVIVFQVPGFNRLMLMTDAAINIAPTLEQKADICRNAIDLAIALGVERPKVAILAAVETVTSKMPATLDAAALCKMAERGQIRGAVLDGPLAFDNAISKEAARMKGIRSEVAGDPDILLVPDLEAGNMLAKQLSFLANADSAGLVLGARVPIILTSRADTVRSRIASCAVAMLVAHARRQGTKSAV